MARALTIAYAVALLRSATAGLGGVGPETASTSAAPPMCADFEGEEVDTDVSGILLAKKWALTSDDCCAWCGANDACEAYSFADNLCYLKTRFLGTYSKAGVVTRVKKAEKCAGFAAAEEDKDLVGRLLEHWHALAPEVCCRACGRKPECQGFAFYDSRCYLKTDVTHTYNQTGCVIQVKEGMFATTPAPTCSADFEVEEVDTDISGIVIAKKWALTSDGCCALCEEEAECEGFTFFDHACYLKKDFVGTYTTVGAVSRVKKVEQCAGFEAAQEDADLAGRDLEDWQAPAPEVCCRACGRKPECQGFAFSDSRCYLKADVTHTYKQTGVVVHVKEGVFSTTPAPTCSASFEVEEADTDISGTLIVKRWALTSDGCCALCEEEAECEGFTFFDHACYLKKDFVGTYTTVGAVSRVKKVEQCAGFDAAQEDADLAGRDLEDWKAPAPEVCCKACGRKEECQGFAFFDDRCYLKADVTHVYGKKGCVAQMKEGVAGEHGGGRRLLEAAQGTDSVMV